MGTCCGTEKIEGENARKLSFSTPPETPKGELGKPVNVFNRRSASMLSD